MVNLNKENRKVGEIKDKNGNKVMDLYSYIENTGELNFGEFLSLLLIVFAIVLVCLD